MTKGREVGTGFRALFDYTVIAVDRAAQCFADGGRSQDDLFGWAFWDLMYGPFMDGDDGPVYGMVDLSDGDYGDDEWCGRSDSNRSFQDGSLTLYL